MKYTVVRIDEDIDFGCEERAADAPIMAVVTLRGGDDEERKLRQPDQMLYDKDINEGDTVILNEKNELQKPLSDDSPKRAGNWSSGPIPWMHGKRMIGYLSHYQKLHLEDIADEMLSILSDRNRIMAKKETEAANARWNEMTWNGFPGSDEED